jgi:membrane-associated protein
MVIHFTFAGHYLYGFLLENYQIDLKKHIELIVLALVDLQFYL